MVALDSRRSFSSVMFAVLLLYPIWFHCLNFSFYQWRVLCNMYVLRILRTRLSVCLSGRSHETRIRRLDCCVDPAACRYEGSLGIACDHLYLKVGLDVTGLKERRVACLISVQHLDNSCKSPCCCGYDAT